MVTKMNGQKLSRMLQFLIVGMVLLLVVAVIAIKYWPQSETIEEVSELPEIQLERALNEGKPTLAFFHSSSCDQCKKMIETVDQVYPDFHDLVELVDVDVYNSANDPLLDKVGLMYIPTLIFYDDTGQGKTFIGVMENGMLREWLVEIAGAD
jgi:thiol-disulfide isomerase/thioredoxin